MSKSVKATDIYKATEEYVDNFQKYDITRVVDSMLKKLKIKDYQVYKYAGVFTENTDFSKIKYPTNKKYNVGITSFALGGMDHYTAFIESEGILYVWDSTYSNMMDSGVVDIYKELFPKHIIDAIDDCEGCFQNFTDGNQYTKQNIFCHTWCIWWIHNVFFYISKGYTISQALEAISSICSTALQNLITIKQFAKELSLNYLDYPVSPYFDYVWSDKKAIKVLE